VEKLIRGSLKDFPVRFFAVNSTTTIKKMKDIHSTTPTATAAAGRVLTATILLSSILKNDTDKVSIIVEGDGDIGRIIATSGIEPEVKCDIFNPQIELMIKENGKLDVARAIGKGYFTVTYDTGNNKPYSGRIELLTSEIGEDLAYYFAKSDQIPSVVSLGVLVGKGGEVINAGGFIIQLMPGCDESMIPYLEEKVNSMKPLTSMFSDGYSMKDIINELFEDYDYTIHSEKDVKYYCDCSTEKIEKALIAIGKEELEDILSEQDNIELKCHFCNSKYNYSKDRIKEILLNTTSRKNLIN
jgi:molecular chaperone Hsp33